MDAYNLIIRFGRMISNGHKFEPELVLSTIQYIDKELRWTPIADFFTLFPPIKNHEDDGTWDYKTTNEMIQRDLGERFGKGDFLHLLMNRCYENKYLEFVGMAFVIATSDMSRKRTGRHLLTEFFR
jgi:hypothetical protein